MTIGEYIKERRNIMKFSQDAVGKAVGVNRSTVQRWENNKMDIDRKHIASLCNVLHMDPVIFCHPNEAIFSDERQILEAWRKADNLTRAMVRRNLGIEEKNGLSESAI